MNSALGKLVINHCPKQVAQIEFAFFISEANFWRADFSVGQEPDLTKQRIFSARQEPSPPNNFLSARCKTVPYFDRFKFAGVKSCRAGFYTPPKIFCRHGLKPCPTLVERIINDWVESNEFFDARAILWQSEFAEKNRSVKVRGLLCDEATCRRNILAIGGWL